MIDDARDAVPGDGALGEVSQSRGRRVKRRYALFALRNVLAVRQRAAKLKYDR